MTYEGTVGTGTANVTKSTEIKIKQIPSIQTTNVNSFSPAKNKRISPNHDDDDDICGNNYVRIAKFCGELSCVVISETASLETPSVGIQKEKLRAK
jgi:hypothetical protein